MILPIASLFLAPGFWLVIIFALTFQARHHLLPKKEDAAYVKIFLAFALWALGSGALSGEWQVFLASFVVPGMYALTVFLISYCKEEETVRRILYYSYIFGILAAVIGIAVEWFDIGKEPSFWRLLFGIADLKPTPETEGRLAATFFNANVAATFLGALLMAGIFFIGESRGRRRLYFCLGQGILLTALLMTGSRGALLGVFIGFFFYFLGKRNKWLTVGTALVCAAWLFLMLAFPQIFSRGELLLSDFDIRHNIWLNSIQLIQMRPIFGWGYAGTYFLDSGVYTYLKVFHPHNIVLTALVFFGVGGFLLCCLLELAKLKAAVRLFRSGDPIAPLLFAVGGIFWGQGIFDCTIVSPQGGILYFGVSALLIALAKQRETEGEKPESSPPLH